MEREMTPFFGLYYGVPMTGKTPPSTLMRADIFAALQAEVARLAQQTTGDVAQADKG